MRMINSLHRSLNLHRPEKIDLTEGLQFLPPPITQQAKRAAADASVVASNAIAVIEVGIPALDATDSERDEELHVANDDAEEKG
jgi:hypothetical protein